MCARACVCVRAVTGRWAQPGGLMIDTMGVVVVVVVVLLVPAASRCLRLGLNMNEGPPVLQRWRLGRESS